MKQEILDLIEMAIADGEITEKERSIILRKAKTLGEDVDEVEMILEGKLALIKKQAKPNIEKAGNVITCPQCKADVPSFTSNCEYCGHEFRNVKNSKTVRDLLNELESIDKSKPMPKGNFFSFKGDKQDLMENEFAQRKIQLINLFPIPNSKEDILEFLSIGMPYANKVKKGISSFFSSEFFNSVGDTVVVEQKINMAWKAKCEQLIVKAKFSMKNDINTMEDINLYAKQLGIK